MLYVTTGPARGNQGAWGQAAPTSLNINHTPPVTGALGVIGLSGRAHHHSAYGNIVLITGRIAIRRE